ncbi:hypothetical protein RRG08_065522 [Elysia crispata]|uniref:Uncharacterized protein n=1 Tax=Elysia crispata TaxID=231223 RepID=A0AAE1D9J3_9GAST|nr:hypothetical protein RRG08_065522 [Elysia crispata]
MRSSQDCIVSLPLVVRDLTVTNGLLGEEQTSGNDHGTEGLCQDNRLKLIDHLSVSTRSGGSERFPRMTDPSRQLDLNRSVDCPCRLTDERTSHSSIFCYFVKTNHGRLEAKALE